MGRPTSYKREQLLGDVTELFWRQGYFATSVADLVETTQLNPGSIYNAFGNKKGLLIAALDYYGDQSIKRARKSIQQDPDIEKAIAAFYQRLIDAMVTDPHAKGCFLVNAWLEMASHEASVKAHIQSIFDRIEAVFRDGLEAAQRRGELKAEANPSVLAKYVMMSIWGLRVMGRMKPEREQLLLVAEEAMAPLRASIARHDFDLAL